jgi:cbb3-type cytochrome oxidase maturation protein
VSSLFVLVPLGIVFTAVGVAFLLFGVRSGQFERLDELGRKLPDDF